MREPTDSGVFFISHLEPFLHDVEWTDKQMQEGRMIAAGIWPIIKNDRNISETLDAKMIQEFPELSEQERKTLRLKCIVLARELLFAEDPAFVQRVDLELFKRVAKLL